MCLWWNPPTQTVRAATRRRRHRTRLGVRSRNHAVWTIVLSAGEGGATLGEKRCEQVTVVLHAGQHLGSEKAQALWGVARFDLVPSKRGGHGRERPRPQGVRRHRRFGRVV